MRIGTLLLLAVLFSPAAARAEWNHWHTPETFIFNDGPGETHVVQLGPKPVLGTRSAMECQVLAFYKNGQALKTYSRYDIVKMSPSLEAPKEHHKILGRAHGFHRSEAGRLVFEVESYQGDILSFDVETGEWMKT